MALSQIQCLDDNHVNPRTHESKPEFLYSENQRLALEALLRDGREAFIKFLEDRGLRGFLSDLEQEALSGTVEPYDPGIELYSENDEEDTSPLSQHYWPDLSDTSIPQLDLGWPDCEAYRGVTRTTVHTQPPLDGQAHIKEVVRKMIAQAQKVIAVVMDIFTDVDIFRDLLDAGFKRRVSVYILLERTTLPHFLSMCQRANMHAGHLKHLRVRCTGGTEFHTRFSTRVRGRMGHRFMFIDGDKAMSGSYSFTWMSSRLDRNLITVVTGQGVGGFDHLFRILYSSSTSVDFQEVTMDPEPEPDPVPQQVALTPPSAAIARKMYSAKYALVALSNLSPTTSVSTPKEPEISEKPKKKRRRRASKEDVQEGPPLHPGLVDLEKVYLMDYLPTWPEPDPPSDVIGFINIRDAKKPTQVHLQRSEMFETSQAIRFSSPFSQPKEILPEVAKPRQLTVNHWDLNKYEPALTKTKVKEPMVDKAQPAQVSVACADIKNKENTPGQKSPASGQKSEPDKNTSKINNTENRLSSNTATNYKAGNTPPPLSAHTLPQSSSKALTPSKDNDSHTTQTVSTNSPKPDSCLESKKAVETLTSLNTRRAVVYRTHIMESNSTQHSQLPDPADSKSNTKQDTQEKTVLSARHSHTQEVHVKPEISSEVTPNIKSPIGRNHISTSSASPMVPTFRSDNNHIGITTAHSTTPTTTTTSACVSVPSTSISSSLFTSSNTTLNPPLPSSSSSESSSLTSAPPVPKRRTCQLVIKDSSISNDEKLPTISVVKRLEIREGRLVEDSEAGVATPAKEPETVPEVQDNSASKTGAQKDTKDPGNPKEALQQKQSVTSHETKGKEADGRHGRAGEQSVPEAKLQTQSDVLITDAPKQSSGDTRKVIPKDVGPKTLTSGDSKITPKTETDGVATSQRDAPEKRLRVPNEKDENVTSPKLYLAKAHEPQRISYYKLTPEDIGVFDDVDSIKAPIRTSVSKSHNSHTSKDSAADNTRTSAADTHSQQGKLPRSPAAQSTDSLLNTPKHNSSFQDQIPKSRGGAQTLHLHLSDAHVPDLRSPTTPERESRLLTALARTPTPDGFLPRTPTSDSRATTPDPRSYTPDFRTPTPDGYVSAVSTTSEEYFECSDSPLNDPVFDHVGFLNHGLMEDHVGFTLTSSPKATSPGTSPGLINYIPGASQLGTASRNTSSSELQTLSGPAGGSSSSSSSSSLGKKVKMREGELSVNEEKKERKEEDGKGRKGSVAERESQKTERQDSVLDSKTVDHFKQTAETAEKKEPQVPRRKRVVNQSAADKLTDGGVTAGESTNEGTDSKRWSTSDLKLESAAERPDKGFSWREKALNRALRPSGARDNLQSTRETEIQKLLQSPSKAQRLPQQDPGALPPSRPPRASRPLSTSQALAPRPWTNRQLSQTDSKVLHGSLQVLDNMSSARKPPPRPPPPAAVGAVGPAAGRKQVQSLLSRQVPAAQSRARAGQMQTQTPHAKPQASFLHSAQQPEPHPQNHTASEQDAHGSDEGRAPFTFTFSRLYSLRGLKDRMGKVPAQSKRSSASPPVQGHKSTN